MAHIPTPDAAKLDSIIARVPVLADASDITIGHLHGGLSNTNYLVDADGDKYVVRIACENWRLLGIDRLREESAERQAVAAGISPELVAVFQPDGYSVTRFLRDAHAVPADRFASPEMIPRLSSVLRNVHALEPIEGKFDPLAEIARMADVLDAHDIPQPARLRPLIERVTAMGRRLGAIDDADLVLCHNDPYHLNFLDDGARLWLIDWEYAGMGNRMYDLAGVGSVLDAEVRDLLLESYFGSVESSMRTELDTYIEVYVCWNVVWCLIQIEDSAITYDYMALAEKILDRLG